MSDRARVVAPETKARIIAAIREWNDVVGRPPVAADWNTSSPKHKPPALTSYRRWPAINGVRGAFGSWNAAIKAAGFEPLTAGYRRDVEGWLRSMRSQERNAGVRTRRDRVAELWSGGSTAVQIAEELGIRKTAVYADVHHLRAEGVELERRS